MKNKCEDNNLTIDEFVRRLDKKKLPNYLNISTMTVTCSYPVSFDLKNIAKKIKLSNPGIVYINWNQKVIRYLDEKFISKKQSNKSFYNQLTIRMISKYKEKPVNIKIFRNGSIQMTGCNSSELFVDCITNLNNLINTSFKNFIDDKKTMKNNSLSIDDVFNLKINMINANYEENIIVDRQKLYNILISKNIKCIYEKSRHASVNIKFKNDESVGKPITIFIFEKGKISINGGRTMKQILDAHKFVTKILIDNYNDILISDFSEFTQQFEIKYLVSYFLRKKYLFDHRSPKLFYR